MAKNKKTSRKAMRQQKREQQEFTLNKKFQLKSIEPMTETQAQVFDAYDTGDSLTLSGSAGTGKTFLSMFLALENVFDDDRYNKVMIIRSSVQSRDQGHMPGTPEEKMAKFELPYVAIVNDLLNRGDGYEILKKKRQIEFASTSFIRGMTYDNTIIVVDECQNMNYDELRTIITRVGKNTKIIFCGDTKQDDLSKTKNRADNSGYGFFKGILSDMSGFTNIEFTREDIVRSGMVRDFIIAEEDRAMAA